MSYIATHAKITEWGSARPTNANCELNLRSNDIQDDQQPSRLLQSQCLRSDTRFFQASVLCLFKPPVSVLGSWLFIQAPFLLLNVHLRSDILPKSKESAKKLKAWSLNKLIEMLIL